MSTTKTTTIATTSARIPHERLIFRRTEKYLERRYELDEEGYKQKLMKTNQHTQLLIPYTECAHKSR